MRTLSTAAIDIIYGADTGVAMLPLLTIEHAEMTTTRLVNNTVDVTSRSNTYSAVPFNMNIPAQSEGELPRVDLVIDNIGLDLMEAIRSITGQPTITLEFVMSNALDTVEVGPFVFSLKNIEYNQFQIRGQCGLEPLLTEPFSDNKFTPIDFPGLFTSVR